MPATGGPVLHDETWESGSLPSVSPPSWRRAGSSSAKTWSPTAAGASSGGAPWTSPPLAGSEDAKAPRAAGASPKASAQATAKQDATDGFTTTISRLAGWQDKGWRDPQEPWFPPVEKTRKKPCRKPPCRPGAALCDRSCPAANL